MAKLYPPSIEGKLPAYAGSSLVIPFTMNRTVSKDSVHGMAVLVKTISTGRIILSLDTGSIVETSTGYAASFTDDRIANSLNSGQYYKVQIAYINNNDIGFYSPVGTFKSTTIPDVKIPLLEKNTFGNYEYTGTYSQVGGDVTEKIYSYSFELTDVKGNLVETSGVLLHNSEGDNDTGKTEDTWKSTVEMEKDQPYYLTYKVTTMNGLTANSPRYMVMSEDSIDIDLDIELRTELNQDDGCVEVKLAPSKAEDIVISGSFVLVRSSSSNNFNSWDEVYKFSYLNTALNANKPLLLWEDCTVEQGEEYLYAIQAYNSNDLYSNRLNAKNGKIKIDFVDAFLYDGKRQLKIQFNPKISSFKNNVLETKMDTLGSKYPFIFKNGYVHYKEFQISGLISLLSDESGKFMVENELVETNRLSSPAVALEERDLKTNLSAENIYDERQFKLTVLEWLNNGEAKIFRSPTEGNYIVRIMNVSLTPNDTLGRMLHTFQCTAYEIMDWNFKNLTKAKLIELPESSTLNLKIGQIKPLDMIALKKKSSKEYLDKYPLFKLNSNYRKIDFGTGAFSANITEATPGTILGLTFPEGDVKNPEVTIEIGGTGSYYVQQREYAMTAVRLISGNWDDLKITFEYYDDTPTDAFSNISKITMSDEIRRFIGPGYYRNIPVKSEDAANTNHIISDIRREVGSFHYIRVEKRYIQEIWPTERGYSRNSIGNDIIADDEWNPALIYHNMENNMYYDGNATTPLIKINEDGEVVYEPDFRFRLNSPTEKVYTDLGGRPVEASESIEFGATFGRIDALRNVGKVDILQIGNGLIADVAYRVRTKEYVVESEDQDTINAKAEWEEAQNEIENAIKNKQSTKYIQDCIDTANEKYTLFIKALKRALERRGIEV